MASNAGSLKLSSFEQALANFRSNSGLSASVLSQMEVTTLTDLQRELITMQKSQQKSRTARYLKRLQPFLDAMEQYGKVVEIFVNASDIVAFVWTVSNVTHAFDTLLQGYLSIGENMPLLVQYRQLFEDHPYMQKALVSIFEDILAFHLEAVKLFTQKTWRQLFHATQRALTKHVEDIANSMQRHQNILKAQIDVVQFENFQQMQLQLRDESALQRANERDRRRARLQNWFGLTINTLARHEDKKKDRFGNTGQWLLDDCCFKRWYTPSTCDDGLLWLNGMPGAGKSVLASRVVEEVQKLKGVVGAYFYCKYTDDPTTALSLLMKSIISQVLAANDGLLEYLYEEMCGSGQAILTSSELIEKLTEVSLRSCPKAYVIIDGLDEYPRDCRKKISSWFRGLVEKLAPRDHGSIRCLFTSQDDGVGRKDLATITSIKITPDQNGADIKDFCVDWHTKIEAKFGALVSPVHDVATVVSERSAGMFLYAKLVTWNLHQQTSRTDFEAEIHPDRFPQDLDQAYDRIARRLIDLNASGSRDESIKKLLGWLACAQRPFKWYEIQAAAAIDLDTGSYDGKRRFLESCKDLCASLVEISSDQTVTLVHSTTKDYLIRKNYVCVPIAHCDLATLCLTYLNMQEFKPTGQQHEVRSAYMQGLYAFAEYAVCFWPIHVERALRDLKIDHGHDHAEMMEILSECFEAFLTTHWNATGKGEEPSTKLRRHMETLRSHDWAEKAYIATATAKSWLRPTGKNGGKDDVLKLPRTMIRLREVFEQTISSTSLTEEEKDLIEVHYGSNHFKCARFNCQLFHRGFINCEQRDQHVPKHDRAFVCPQEDCPYRIFGFTKSEYLQKHAIEKHGVIPAKSDLEFPPHTTSTLTTVETASNKFQCETCGKLFSRAYNLRSHQTTHTEERPFVCSVCDTGFARRSDLLRHEKTHLGEKKFTCEGMNTSTKKRWGCGRSFARADGLALHLRSEAGRACVAALRAYLALPSLDQLPEVELTDNAILRYLEWKEWQGYEDIVWNPFATQLDTSGTSLPHENDASSTLLSHENDTSGTALSHENDASSTSLPNENDTTSQD